MIKKGVIIMKKFVNPEIEIEMIQMEDIITTSAPTTGNDGLPIM